MCKFAISFDGHVSSVSVFALDRELIAESERQGCTMQQDSFVLKKTNQTLT